MPASLGICVQDLPPLLDATMTRQVVDEHPVYVRLRYSFVPPATALSTLTFCALGNNVFSAMVVNGPPCALTLRKLRCPLVSFALDHRYRYAPDHSAPPCRTVFSWIGAASQVLPPSLE